MYRLSACLGILILSLTACIVVPPDHHRHGGPPDRAPAYGYRAPYHYRYYPEVGIYYDINRSLYFYMDNGWHSSPVLPRHMRVIGAPVDVDIDDDTPYSHYNEHHSRYPGHPRG